MRGDRTGAVRTGAVRGGPPGPTRANGGPPHRRDRPGARGARSPDTQKRPKEPPFPSVSRPPILLSASQVGADPGPLRAKGTIGQHGGPRHGLIHEFRSSAADSEGAVHGPSTPPSTIAADGSTRRRPGGPTHRADPVARRTGPTQGPRLTSRTRTQRNARRNRRSRPYPDRQCKHQRPESVRIQGPFEQTER
jgi:hypothetical protein